MYIAPVVNSLGAQIFAVFWGEICFSWDSQKKNPDLIHFFNVISVNNGGIILFSLNSNRQKNLASS